MAYELVLPKKFKSEKWKVKIRDRERVEPPHVTVLNKTRSWRIGLRDGAFLDRDPPPGDVPKEIVDFIHQHFSELIDHWNAIYPENPVEGE